MQIKTTGSDLIYINFLTTYAIDYTDIYHTGFMKIKQLKSLLYSSLINPKENNFI